MEAGFDLGDAELSWLRVKAIWWSIIEDQSKPVITPTKKSTPQRPLKLKITKAKTLAKTKSDGKND